MFRFAHPEYFFLLLLIPVLIGVYVYAGIKKRRNLKKFGNPDLLAELMPNVSRVRPLVKFYLQLAAVSSIIPEHKPDYSVCRYRWDYFSTPFRKL